MIQNLTVLPILFLVFVAPLWLFLHYKSKRQVSQGFTEEECEALTAMGEKAEAMRERITTLESLLDHEAPEWRNRS
ncbi:MAG: envelope stress response membrane protein PspB [Psychromonas sp.]|nr:envelope stress response membrane protein PspB [Alteromonadales bacterium]MCP5079117.1 envelope stress response membrane protein PspB [Psychromonas sp.]